MPLRVIKDRHGGANLYIRGTVRGIRVEESTGTARRDLAEQYRIKREAEIFAESLGGRRLSRTFAEAMIDYIEAGRSKRFLDRPLAHFGELALDKIGAAEIHAGARKAYPNAASATRDRQFVTPTVAVLKHAARLGWCAPPLMARERRPDGVVRWLTPDEAERLLEAAGIDLRPLLIFLLYTGSRIGEALWLDWRHLDLERRHVSFQKTKNGRPRGVPLHTRVVAALANLPHREGCVFRKPGGEPYARPRSADDTSAGTRIKVAFKAAVRRAGLVDVRVHDLRHTWATWHYAENRDLIALQQLGGWSSERMVLRYAHVNADQLRHTIDRLPGEKPGKDRAAEAKKA